jgi:hypothetical protein
MDEFKKGYQPRNDTVKDEKVDFDTDCHRNLVRWRSHFSHLFNVHEVSNVKQTEIHTEKPLVPEPSVF